MLLCNYYDDGKHLHYQVNPFLNNLLDENGASLSPPPPTLKKKGKKVSGAAIHRLLPMTVGLKN